MRSRDNDHGDEAALLAALRRGEPGSHELLIRRHGARMLAAARRVLGHEEDARDALQDALLSAFGAIGSFAGGSQLSTWLHRIAVNAALMKLRHRRSRPEASLDELLPQFLDDGHHQEPPCPFGDRASALLQAGEHRALLRAAIDELPANYREILLLRDLEELSTTTTAELLGITENAVKIRLHRARQALRTLLAPRFGDQTP